MLVDQPGYLAQCRLTADATQLLLQGSGKEATVIDGQGKSWTIVCLQTPNGAAFLTGPGWKGLVQAWKLQLGDELAFERRQDGQKAPAVHVSILRQGKELHLPGSNAASAAPASPRDPRFIVSNNDDSNSPSTAHQQADQGASPMRSMSGTPRTADGKQAANAGMPRQFAMLQFPPQRELMIDSA
ncbi:hypothetical protein WJX73_010335 [Symbiochloris irregularis]|uniref:TF-B3 domain-containing protein n=1 Tax=Symbiochloris irregularis TaxID=706552 RepID=A0AAW1P250_9CHLO